jgi:hypothetical protein
MVVWGEINRKRNGNHLKHCRRGKLSADKREFSEKCLWRVAGQGISLRGL